MRYGERTARGIAEGTKVTWALTLRERRRARSGKKSMVSRDTKRVIALFRPSDIGSTGRKPDRGNGHSQGGTGQLRPAGLRVKGEDT